MLIVKAILCQVCAKLCKKADCLGSHYVKIVKKPGGYNDMTRLLTVDDAKELSAMLMEYLTQQSLMSIRPMMVSQQ